MDRTKAKRLIPEDTKLQNIKSDSRSEIEIIDIDDEIFRQKIFTDNFNESSNVVHNLDTDEEGDQSIDETIFKDEIVKIVRLKDIFVHHQKPRHTLAERQTFDRCVRRNRPDSNRKQKKSHRLKTFRRQSNSESMNVTSVSTRSNATIH